MQKPDYDIIVVGCGPGGATAANFAALNGMRVLVVDQKREVGLPIQDGVSVLYSMSEAEEYAGIKIPFRWVETQIGESAFFSPSGYYNGGQTWPDGISIRRSMWEKGLAENAGEHGAHIVMDTRLLDVLKDKNGKVKGVKVINGNEIKEFTCSIVIGADGVYGKVAHTCGIPLPTNPFVGLTYEMVGVYPKMKMPTYEIHIGDKISPGFFSWVIPHSDGKVGVGITLSPEHLKEDITARGILKRFMKHLEDIDRYHFDKASMVAMVAGGSTTVREPGAKYVDDNVMVIGDAAWRPMLGTRWGSAGMLTAIITGRWAAETAAQAIKEGDTSAASLSRYPEKCAKSLGGRTKEIAEAREYYNKVIFLPDDKKDKAVKEIGKQISTLHLFLRGAFELTGCLPPVKAWFEKEGLS